FSSRRRHTRFKCDWGSDVCSSDLHGSEPLDRGGTVTVSGRVVAGNIEIAVTNPVAAARNGQSRVGNRIALDNIRQRLELAYNRAATLTIEQPAGEYRVTIRFPYTE